ncbi:hypothetical protein Kpho01_18820 [Kitasatospora phosalacinea]|uniref:Uncharacterized protein n=1 Tax=Kitasatospora phosalacinea TaxID=2065 RepID=A0A9W6PEY7_9ACTN|nr:hypothetical protein Kpho01_18820 [Kitasatospora phosalacinea]
MLALARIPGVLPKRGGERARGVVAGVLDGRGRPAGRFVAVAVGMAGFSVRGGVERVERLLRVLTWGFVWWKGGWKGVERGVGLLGPGAWHPFPPPLAPGVFAGQGAFQPFHPFHPGGAKR